MREPDPTGFVIPAVVWLLAIQTPFMVLIGYDWLGSVLPRRVYLLVGLYSILVPYGVAYLAYRISKRRYTQSSKKEAAHV